MDYNNNGNNINHRNKSTPTDDKVKAGAAGAGLGIGAIIVIAVIALAAFFMFNNKEDTPASVTNDVGRAAGSVYSGTADVVKEVPQAAEDAVTEGDQATTRPNADGSTEKLDQK